MLRVIVVDDEKPSLDKLEKVLCDSGLAEVVRTFTEPMLALEFLKQNKVDAAFLDIEMPDMDGIELASRIIDLQGSIAVVFVTAYNQYAVEAFRLNALDYLMKPVSVDRLKETLHRIIDEKGIPLHCPEGAYVQCFGKFCVIAGTEEVRFRTEKAEELLAFLIDKRGKFVSRSEIIDTLWEDFDGDKALIHFNTTLHYVKKALLPYGIQISIQYDRGCYRLDTSELNCDYIKFCAFAGTEKSVGRESILEFEEMIALYSGEYLCGWECDWAVIRRLLLEEQFICILLETAEYYKVKGDYQESAKCLKKGLLYEPLHRELNYRLIEILMLSSEHILATRYYDIYKSGLLKKLKEEPDIAFKKIMLKN